MNYFIVGDVHGCYYTLRRILERWNPSKEQLMFVGDLINKGAHSKEVVQLVRRLQDEYPTTICVKGNHEYQMVQYIKQKTARDDMKESYRNTLKKYHLDGKDRSDYLWMESLPLTYENDVLYLSHAGVNFLGVRKFKENSMWSVLRFRGKLKRMNKLQVIGHTPTLSKRPEYNAKFHSLNIDSGAGNFDNMSAVVINNKGRMIKSYIEKVDKDDRP